MNFRPHNTCLVAPTTALSIRKRAFPVVVMVMMLNLSVLLSATAAVTPDRTNVCAAPFNAIPNDGLDDTAAINLAISPPTPTPPPGSTPVPRSIYFPPGTYNYTGRLTLPVNTSFRLYGDGPGVATILFSTNQGNPTAGIRYGPDTLPNTLNIEGLTLKANSINCGTAIDAIFGPVFPDNAKCRTASIHNVQIIGSARDGISGTWWTSGIHLYKGQNSVIDKVHISGNKFSTQTGILLDSSPDADATTGLELTNLEVKWCNTALQTNGHVEGLYMTGFEFVSCGRSGQPVIGLSTIAGGVTAHLVNGLVDAIGNGIVATNFPMIKISNVSFRHTGPEATLGTMISINDGFDTMVTECSFYGVDSGTVSDENGIFLTNAHSVRIAGNNFSHMQPGNGSCIVVYGSSSVVRITDNLFSNVRQQYNDQAPLHDTYYLGNNP